MAGNISTLKGDLSILVLRAIYFNQAMPEQVFRNGSSNPVNTIRALTKSGFVFDDGIDLKITDSGKLKLFKFYKGAPKMIELREEFLADEDLSDNAITVAGKDVAQMSRRLALEE